MRIESADNLAKALISLQAVLISFMLLVMGWLMQQEGMNSSQPSLQGPLLWVLLFLLVAAWLWLCHRAWLGYLSPGGMRVQWPFWVLVAVQLPSFPLGTMMAAGLIFLKIKYHPQVV